MADAARPPDEHQRLQEIHKSRHDQQSQQDPRAQSMVMSLPSDIPMTICSFFTLPVFFD
jgi:hypothetical protein